jgi:predicted transposase YbfD/YdcC
MRSPWVYQRKERNPHGAGVWEPDLSGIGLLERTREIKGKISRERAYFIGGKGVTCSEAFAVATRRHGGIENARHWVLDVTFREGGGRVRGGCAPRNFSAFSQVRAGAVASG